MNGWYWKHTHWNEYTLTGPNGEVKKFRTYADLCIYCVKHNIDATKA